MIPPHCRNPGIGTAHFRINYLLKQLLESMYVLHTYLTTRKNKPFKVFRLLIVFAISDSERTNAYSAHINVVKK